MARAVDVGLEFRTLLGDAPALGKAEDLIPAAVGQDGPIPPGEPMQATEPSDQFIARTKVEMVGVAENDLGARLLEVLEEHPLHRALGAHGHERRCVHDAVRRLKLAEPGGAVGLLHRESKRIVQDEMGRESFAGDVGVWSRDRERPQQMTPDPFIMAG